MYGLINKAVEGLVRQRFGDAMWHRIRSGANLPDEPFLSMEQYPDATTYALVGSALRHWLTQGRRLLAFNRVLAGVLVATAAWMAVL